MITGLKIMIDRSGYKQKYIAKQIGIDAAILSKIVSGDRPLNSEVKKKLADILRTTEQEIEQSFLIKL